MDATYTGVLKPDPAAYHLCLRALGLPAQACVFVDDQARNVAGAQAVGMVAVHFDVCAPQVSCDEAARALGLEPAPPSGPFTA